MDYHRTDSIELLDPRMDFPPHSAMEDVLLHTKQPTNKKKKRLPEATHRDDPVTLDTPVGILDVQAKELDAYRDTVKRMEDDVASLHDQLSRLQTTNAQLRRQVVGGTDGAKSSRPSPDGSTRKLPATEKETEDEEAKRWSRKEATEYPTDNAKLCNKTDLRGKCDLLTKRVNRQTNALKEYRDKVLMLQQELIQKNEREKASIRQSIASLDYPSRQLEKQLQLRTSKIRGLEEAYSNQEIIIEKMEKLLETRYKGDKDLHESRGKIIEENKRLRQENQILTEQNRLMAKNRKDEEDMLQLRQKLDRDGERIRTLEQKLVENSRRWAHEKSDLQTRLEAAEQNNSRRPSVLDSARRPVAQQIWSAAGENDRTTDSRLKSNRSSSKNLPSIYA